MHSTVFWLLCTSKLLLWYCFIVAAVQTLPWIHRYWFYYRLLRLPQLTYCTDQVQLLHCYCYIAPVTLIYCYCYTATVTLPLLHCYCYIASVTLLHCYIATFRYCSNIVSVWGVRRRVEGGGLVVHKRHLLISWTPISPQQAPLHTLIGSSPYPGPMYWGGKSTDEEKGGRERLEVNWGSNGE